MLRSALAAAAASLAFTAAAHADDSPRSPEAIAKAHAFAEGKIQAAQAGDLFEVVDYRGIPTARHLKSGLRCHFLGDADLIHIVPSKLPRGDDVGCSMHYLGFTMTLYATRFPQAVSVEQAFANYQGEVSRMHPDAKPFTGPDHDMRVHPDPAHPPFPEIKTQRYEIVLEGKEVYSRLSVAVVNGWVLEERVTGPLDQAPVGDQFGSTEMLRSVNWIHGGDLMPE